MKFLNVSTVFAAKKNFLASTILGDMLLLDTDLAIYYEFNEVAIFIWTLLVNSPLTIPEITSMVQKEFEVDEVECAGDIEVLLKQILDDGLVEIIN